MPTFGNSSDSFRCCSRTGRHLELRLSPRSVRRRLKWSVKPRRWFKRPRCRLGAVIVDAGLSSCRRSEIGA